LQTKVMVPILQNYVYFKFPWPFQIKSTHTKTKVLNNHQHIDTYLASSIKAISSRRSAVLSWQILKASPRGAQQLHSFLRMRTEKVRKYLYMTRFVELEYFMPPNVMHTRFFQRISHLLKMLKGLNSNTWIVFLV